VIVRRPIASINPSAVHCRRRGGVRLELQVSGSVVEPMVEQLGSHRTDPAFGECIRPRSAERQRDERYCFAPVNLVEGSGELGIPIGRR
jgi:hypothetical protein